MFNPIKDRLASEDSQDSKNKQQQMQAPVVTSRKVSNETDSSASACNQAQLISFNSLDYAKSYEDPNQLEELLENPTGGAIDFQAFMMKQEPDSMKTSFLPEEERYHGGPNPFSEGAQESKPVITPNRKRWSQNVSVPPH